MYIRKTIIWGTSFVTTRNKNILWIKLDKSFFELDKDLYLGTVYISPNTSQVIDQELLDDIESEIVNFILKGDVILQRTVTRAPVARKNSWSMTAIINFLKSQKTMK